MQEKPKEKQGGFNWLGIVVFLVVVVGPTLWRIANQFLAQAGVTLPASIPVPALIIGAIVVAVVGSVAFQGMRRAGSRSETRLPTSLSEPMRPTTMPNATTTQRPNAPMPPFAGEFGPFFPPVSTSVDSIAPRLERTPQLPRPPRFEPIISGKAVLAAAGVFSLFGLVYVLAIAILP